MSLMLAVNFIFRYDLKGNYWHYLKMMHFALIQEEDLLLLEAEESSDEGNADCNQKAGAGAKKSKKHKRRERKKAELTFDGEDNSDDAVIELVFLRIFEILLKIKKIENLLSNLTSVVELIGEF